MNENDRLMLEEQEHLVNSHQLPPIKREWTIGTVLSFAGSLATLSVFVGGLVWGYSRVTEATTWVPALREEVVSEKTDIAVLKVEQENQAQQNEEILSQLSSINRKLDRIQESKADKDVTQQELQGFRR